MAHRVLSHTADAGIEVTAASLPALFDELLSATFELMAPNRSGADAETTRTIEVTAETLEDLVVDTLSEFLFIAETEDQHFCWFRSEVDVEALAARVEAGSLPLRRDQAAGATIKAVTYHGLVVEQRDGEWFARVYFDV
ncbi:MAG TPA: archease [Acidimicrobiia bacterium]|jgi:SHS2 domain-containing protein